MADKLKMVEMRVQIGNRILRGLVESPLEDEKVPLKELLFHIGEKDKTEAIPLEDINPELREKMLQDLLFQGKVTKTITIGNKTVVVLETLTGNDVLSVVDSSSKETNPPERALRKWDTDCEMIRTLARGIQSFDGKSIGNTREEKERFILGLAWPVTLYLVGCWNRFLVEIGEILEPDVVGDLIRK